MAKKLFKKKEEAKPEVKVEENVVETIQNSVLEIEEITLNEHE